MLPSLSEAEVFQDKTISLPRALVPTARGVLAEWGLLRRSLDLRLGWGWPEQPRVISFQIGRAHV